MELLDYLATGAAGRDFPALVERILPSGPTLFLLAAAGVIWLAYWGLHAFWFSKSRG